MSEKPTVPAHFYRKNTRGLIEAVETATGRILCVQSSHHDLLEKKWERLVKIETAEGPVWIEKGLNFDVIPRLGGSDYSRVKASMICEALLAEPNISLVMAAASVGVSYAELSRWRREVAEFGKMIDEARADRAELYHDEALRIAMASKKPYLQVDTLKWAAEKNDQERFGEKKQVGIGGPQGPITFQLVTNILRPGDPGHEQLKDVTPAALPLDLGEKQTADVVVPDFGGENGA